MHILITNITLATRTGTETFILDFARGLAGRGCQVSVYSPELGAVADELRAAGVFVSDRWADFAAPDLIHGHHNLTTVAALQRFPGVPALFVCHDVWAWHDTAFVHPRLLRYVGISRGTQARLIRHGADPTRCSIVYNFSPMDRFVVRPPLPPRPKRALVFSNHARPDAGFGAIVAEACRLEGLDVDFAGEASGQPITSPEEVLGRYDLVFAKGKAAIEAVATGCATILCDTTGLGPMVTKANRAQIRHSNFGVDFLKEAPTVEAVRLRLADYDPVDAAQTSAWLRNEAGLETALDRWQTLHAELVALPCPRDDEADRIAAADAIGQIAASMRNQQVEVMQDKRPDPALLDRLNRAEQTLSAIEATLSWRLRNRLVQAPLLGQLSTGLSRLFSGRA
jgi:hypothetical protein